MAVKQSMALGRGSLSMSAGHSLEDNFGTSLFISYRRPFGVSLPARSSIHEFDLGLLDSQSAAMMVGKSCNRACRWEPDGLFVGITLTPPQMGRLKEPR